MCKIFFKLELFPTTNAAVGDRSVAQHRKRGKQKNDRRFVILAPKLAHPEIFSSIRRFFKPGEFFGTSPLSAFSQFPSGIYLKPVETRQYSLKNKIKSQLVKYTSYRGCHNFFRPYPGIFGPHPPPPAKTHRFTAERAFLHWTDESMLLWPREGPIAIAFHFFKEYGM